MACMDTQVAALLLWTGHRRSAQDALELFARRRTDVFDPARALQDAEDADDADANSDNADESTSACACVSCASCTRARIGWCGAKGRPRKNQGVDGPSQIRYIQYLEAVLYGQIDPHHAALLAAQSALSQPEMLSESRLLWGDAAQGYEPSNRNRNEVPAGVPYFSWALGEGVSPSGYPLGAPPAPHL